VIFARFGLPMQILSDNGREFDNVVMKELCRLLEVEKLRTTVYKASTNGMVERLHRTLNSMLGKVVETNQRNWDEFLPSMMAAYRSSKHESTGYSPNFLMFGRENIAPLDIIHGVPPGEEQHYESYDAFVDQKVDIMRKAYQLAREHLGTSAERAKKYYDLKVRPAGYHVGQWVWYHCPRRYVGRSPKWQRFYTGPFLVTGVMGPVNVRLQQSKRSQPLISHIDKLKLCLGDTPASWLTVGDEEEVREPINIQALYQPEVDGGGPADELLLEDIRLVEQPEETIVEERIVGEAVNPENGRPKRAVRRPAYLKDFDVRGVDVMTEEESSKAMGYETIEQRRAGFKVFQDSVRRFINALRDPVEEVNGRREIPRSPGQGQWPDTVEALEEVVGKSALPRNRAGVGWQAA